MDYKWLIEYPNTPIIDFPRESGAATPVEFMHHSIYYIISQYLFNLVLPLAMVLYVILHFRDDKNIYLYAVFMSLSFIMFPVWFTLTSGLVLMGLDMASKWSKERKKNSTFIDLDKEQQH